MRGKEGFSLGRPGTNTNQYEPIKYRLSEIYRQYDIANIG